MTALPCPFCGAAMVRTRNGYGHPYLPYSADTLCLLNGHHIGDALLGRWNMRVAPVAMHYYTAGGHPFVNDKGVGTPADATTLNALFAAYHNG